MLIAVLFVKRSRLITPRDLGIRRVPGARSVGYVLVALAALVLFDLISRSVLPAAGPGPFNDVSAQSGLNVALAGIVACASAPVIEELFFRGFIYRSLSNRLPVLVAASFAGIMFGAMHLDSYTLASLPSVTFFGVVACLLYERVGSLLPGIVLHSLIDSRSFELGFDGTSIVLLVVGLGLAAILLLNPLARGGLRFARGEPILREGEVVT
jgi:hypothetical protein